MLQSSDDTHRKDLQTRMQQPASAPIASAPVQTAVAAPRVAAAASNPLLGDTPHTPTLPHPSSSQPAPLTTPATDTILSAQQRDALAYAKGLIEEAEDDRQDAPVQKPAQTDTTTSAKPPSAATIDLATNRPELTIQTISEEAHRIEEKEKQSEDGEVFISLH